MNKGVNLIVMLVIIGAILTIFYFAYSQPRIAVWQNAIPSEGIMTDFTFRKGMQGDIGIEYRVQGRDYIGQLDGFYNDFSQGRNVELIIDNTDYQNVNWASFIRYWLAEFFVFGFFGGILVTFLAYYIVPFQFIKKQVAGITFMCIVGFTMFIVQQYDKSFQQYVKNAEPVLATVIDISTETCESNSNKKKSTYTCYRPTYRYGYGRQSYTMISERTFKKAPLEGAIKELWVWNQNRQVAKDLKSQLPRWAYYLIMSFLGLLFLVGLRTFLGFDKLTLR